MPQERLSMRKISEILRLKHVHKLSNRKIAKACNVGRTTVANYLSKAAEARISWPLPSDLDESRLQALLFPSLEDSTKSSTLVPDWNAVHKELQKKHVTKFLLWEEYKQSNPDGFEYSWFCREYNTWRGKLDLVMRHTHRAGEKLFIDYAGHTMPITHPGTGEIKEAQIFIAVLGASNYTYAEATWTQSLQDWINSHIRTFKYIQGVPLIVVPDNLKSGVHKSHLYEPDLNPTYQDMALHYNTAIIPARKRKPKDKAKAENAVLLVSRWILARIRNQTFFSIHDLNRAIRRLLEILNNKSFKKLDGSRKHLFEELDRPALQPLPETHYEYALWKQVRVNIDYHVEVEKHYYSVPYQLVKKQLDAKYTENIVEIFHKNTRVASHKRSLEERKHSTLNEHMPKSHKEYAAWTPERLLNWAAKSGPSTARLVETIMAKKIHPQQGFRACLGIMRLGKTYGFDRLELACQRTLKLGSATYKSVESILKNNLDKKNLSGTEQDSPKIKHGNIRGSNYYN